MPDASRHPSDHPLLRNLNAPQREAVCHAHGPLLLLAGAGSGKTTVITRRIAWLIEEEGVHPGSILAMTFTNKAAEEMRERVQRLVSVPAAQMWVSTFHSFCTRILRREGERTPVGRDFVIFDPADQKSLMKQVLAELKLPEKQYHPKRVLELISDFKNRCLLPEEAREEALDPWTRRVLDAYDLYQKGLRNHRACDFDDLLLYTERLFRDPVMQAAYGERFKFILVDEYQDTNRAQYLLVQHLAKRHHNLCVVGDEDQSIYGWRGADIRNILDFQQDFPEAVRIELLQNYRSTKKILDAASEVISNNSQRVEGKGALKTDLGEGETITFKLADEGRQEAEWVVQRIQELRYRDPEAKVAVLYRANWQSRQMEEALRAQNLAYRLVGGVKFYERQEVKDLISYLRLVSNPFDLVSFRRCVNAPTRGVGPTTLGKIEGAIPEGGTPLEGLAVLLRSGELKGRAQREMGKFLELFHRAAAEREAQGLSGLVKWVLQESGYLQSLEDEATLEAEGRIRNLEEFLSAAAESESLGLRLSEFLDRITLAADADQVEESAQLSLMTIHCAKGLEFPYVFVIGMEEDVFPNRNARETPEGLEEERRLFYVAITRAQRRLTLSAARRRRVMGTEMLSMPSRFLREIPAETLAAPIRWGTELYQSGEGVRPGSSFTRGAGGSSVATELQRIRSFFDRVKEVPPAEPDGGSFPEPAEAKDPTAFEAGTRVRSPRFGEGTVLAATGRGEGLTYTVRFDQGGDKRIMARFGGLVRA
ncbi:MAG TPA: UvrD-helicase domain-containing protein [Geothrix sp.]|uniref:ATP-dependent helicase n=1 Tax=Geothrix mesophila TaxID=2922723 RepID=UPI001FAC05B8|nr:UvrD-helicase domain-containing protein [Geothrix sp. SG198]HJV38326.1 UvrD-helicase domain-containing protein [Geothrix sp.]